jgi:hypothetical protein
MSKPAGLAASLIVVLSVACGQNAGLDQAGDSDTSLPDAPAVFAAAAEAMGGAEELAGILSIRGVAHCVAPGGAYVTELNSARGGRTWFKQSPVGSQEFLAIVNGEHAWSPAGNQGSVQLSEAVVAMVTGHEFQMIAVDIETRYSEAQVVGMEEFSGAQCVKLRLTDTLGQPMDAFFHTSSHLLAGLRYANPMQPDADVWIRLVEWRQISGVVLPSKVLATDNAGDFVLSFHDISVNNVDESLFEVPEGILRSAE